VSRYEVLKFGVVVAACEGLDATYAAIRLLRTGRHQWGSLRYRRIGSDVLVVPA